MCFLADAREAEDDTGRGEAEDDAVRGEAEDGAG
jgi:hypothetical protein